MGSNTEELKEFENNENNGLLPRVIQYILNKINDTENSNIEYLVKVSFLEIYNEHIYDLVN